MAWSAKVRFALLLAGFVGLYLWRMSGLLAVPGLTDHLSNFYLSGAALTLVAGPQALAGRGARVRVLVAALLLAAVNVVGEVLVGLVGVADEVNRPLGDVNTSDPVDALFGLAAIALVLAVVRPRRTGD